MNAVITCCFGDKYTNISKLTHPSIKAYADKIGADFIVINEKKTSKKYIQYEKFQLRNYFSKYQRIIYIDTDVLIRPDCPNLFDIVPESKIGIFNEGAFMDLTRVMRDACMKYKMSIPKWDRQSYNTGVMVLSRLHKDIFIKPDVEYKSFNDTPTHVVDHYEQPYLNLKIITGKYEIHELDYRYNRIHALDSMTGESPLASYIIHFAGLTHNSDIEEKIQKALDIWKENSPDYKFQRNILVQVGGGLGDQIDTEPIVRYICNHIYPGDNILVQTFFPEIFTHLPVSIIESNNPIPNQSSYYTMVTLPSPEKPLWQFLSQTLCHTTDFASISSIRRILPNREKQIHLKVSLEDIQSLITTIGIRNLNNLVLIHPGKGWESKTFPNEYWQEIIDGISKDCPVALIGRYLSDKQGIVDIECPKNVLDLRNLLNLKELIALVSQAKILVSNDSAPIHIAGAFDNWIVLIPSCKHPDWVLPYRNGRTDYKTLSLYKKLTCDAIDSSPTMVHGQTIDYVVGDIKNYLLESSKVIEIVNKLYGGLS